MAEEALVYVAGERDAYPMEFYDRQSASYQGVVPRLLEAFSARSGYQVAYYTGLEGASKESLARNAQVDMIYSCIPARERAPQAEADPEDTASAEAAQPLVLFESELGGELVYHTITFTPAAPAGLREALEQFLSEVSTAQLNGLLLDSATVYQPPGIQYPVVVGLAVLVALLAAALAAALRCYRRRLNDARRSLETDPVTGLGNFADLQRRYRQLVNDRNRALFNMVCFSMDIDGLRLLAGSGEVDQVLKECAVVLREYVEDGALARVSESAFALMRTDTDPVQTVDWVENAVNRLRTCPQGQADRTGWRLAPESIRCGRAIWICSRWCSTPLRRPTTLSNGKRPIWCFLRRRAKRCKYKRNCALRWRARWIIGSFSCIFSFTWMPFNIRSWVARRCPAGSIPSTACSCPWRSCH